MTLEEAVEKVADYARDYLIAHRGEITDRAVDGITSSNLELLLWANFLGYRHDRQTLEKTLVSCLNYLQNPERIRESLANLLLPGSRWSTEGRRILAGVAQANECNTANVIERPIILVPGMTGTRLRKKTDRPGDPQTVFGPLERDANLLCKMALGVSLDELVEIVSNVLPVPPDLLRTLGSFTFAGNQTWRTNMAHALRDQFDPDSIWDPDTPLAMVDLVNKTPTERAELFDASVPAEPISHFSAMARNALTLFNVPAPIAAILRVLEDVGHFGFRFPGAREPLDDRETRVLRESREKRGWGKAVWSISGTWLLLLERNFGPHVYVFGYDWRKPALESGRELLDFIREPNFGAQGDQSIEEAYNGARPILVTHSNGGLVARAAAKSGEDLIGGVVQVFSPTAGAIRMYVNCKKGAGCDLPPGWTETEPPVTFGNDGRPVASADLFTFDRAVTAARSVFDIGDFITDVFWAILLGLDPVTFAVTTHKCPGPYSLLPNNRRRPGGGNRRHDWIQGVIPSSENIFNLYKDGRHPVGIFSDWTAWSQTSVPVLGPQMRYVQYLIDHPQAAVHPFSEVLAFLRTLKDAGLLNMFPTGDLDARQIGRIQMGVHQCIDHAHEFDRVVEDYMHPNTWALSSGDLTTDVGFSFLRAPSFVPGSVVPCHRVLGNEGDATVDLESSELLLPRERVFRLGGVVHAGGMGQSEAARKKLVWAMLCAKGAADLADRSRATTGAAAGAGAGTPP